GQLSYSSVLSSRTPGSPVLPYTTLFRSSTASSVTLQWSDVDLETSYLVQRSSDNTTWSPIATLAADTTTYTDTGLTEATLYYYRFIAHTAVCESPSSTVRSRVTLPNAPI